MARNKTKVFTEPNKTGDSDFCAKLDKTSVNLFAESVKNPIWTLSRTCRLVHSK